MNHPHHYDDADGMLNESISEADEAMSLSGDEDLRLARIDEYRDESLQQKRSLRANLRVIAAGLQEIVAEYESALKNTLHAAVGKEVLDSPHVQRGMSTYLQLTRQIDRYANLELQLEEAEQQAAGFKTRRRRGAR